MANVKITDLAALTTPAAADLLEIVDDVAGTPTSKKITWANLFKAPVMTTPALGTPASGVLTSCTGLPVATGIVAGAANLKLFTNAGATAPEWASGAKVGQASYDIATATGTQDITGIGFQPSSISVHGAIAGTNKSCHAHSDGTLTRGIYTPNYNAAPTTGFWGTTVGIYFLVDSSNYVSGVVSWLADGFRITWTKTGSPTGSAILYYLVNR